MIFIHIKGIYVNIFMKFAYSVYAKNQGVYLNSLSIINYKNLSDKQFSFSKKVNCFVGNNGIGKTNILDAVYSLAHGKSYFNPVATQNIRHGEDFFMLDGTFNTDEQTEHIVYSLKKGQKKVLKRNGKIYEKLSEHVGLIPMVIISPADQDLVSEGSETRRRFLDHVIAQQDSLYLKQLIQYQKVLSQRNALLKYFALNHTFDETTLDIYNEQMTDLGTAIYEKRCVFIKKLIPIFQHYHALITENKEKVNMQYSSHLHDKDFNILLKENIGKDRVLQYSSVGIHRDDLIFEIEDFPLKKYGSQGQQKSFLIALKLAQFEFIKQQKGVLPILLFDDIFDKLDAHRVKQIISLVNENSFGQLFITDTHSERTELIVESTHLDYEIFNI